MSLALKDREIARKDINLAIKSQQIASKVEELAQEKGKIQQLQEVRISCTLEAIPCMSIILSHGHGVLNHSFHQCKSIILYSEFHKYKLGPLGLLAKKFVRSNEEKIKKWLFLS